MEPWFFCGRRERERKRKKNLFQGCQRSLWQSSYHSMSNCSSSRNDLDFSTPPLLFLQSSSKQKPPPPHPLSNFPWRGPAGWGVRMDREGFARGLGWEGARCVIVNVSIFVLEVCTSAWDDCGAGGWGGEVGLHAIFFSKMLQLSPRLSSAELYYSLSTLLIMSSVLSFVSKYI